jgi:hypothetical protein
MKTVKYKVDDRKLSVLILLLCFPQTILGFLLFTGAHNTSVAVGIHLPNDFLDWVEILSANCPVEALPDLVCCVEATMVVDPRIIREWGWVFLKIQGCYGLPVGYSNRRRCVNPFDARITVSFLI